MKWVLFIISFLPSNDFYIIIFYFPLLLTKGLFMVLIPLLVILLIILKLRRSTLLTKVSRTF